MRERKKKMNNSQVEILSFESLSISNRRAFCSIILASIPRPWESGFELGRSKQNINAIVASKAPKRNGGPGTSRLSIDE